jgi:outer membrane biosynthesis protein TonB
MRPHSSSAYLTSLILHAFVAALIMLSAVYMTRREEMPKIIELVAGPPTDMNSLEAPAEGVANPIKMTVPKVELPPDPQPQTQAEQTPSVPETPVVKSVPKPEPVKPPPVTKAKSELSMAKQMAKAAQGSY